jgi:hypothetical protein
VVTLIVSIDGVSCLVLTTSFKLGLNVHGRADNTVCGGGFTDPIHGEMRGSMRTRWGFRVEMEMGFVNAVHRDGGQLAAILFGNSIISATPIAMMGGGAFACSMPTA